MFPSRMPSRGSGPVIEVTEDEFLRAWTEDGRSEKEGRFHWEMSRALGSTVTIGEKRYRPASRES